MVYPHDWREIEKILMIKMVIRVPKLNSTSAKGFSLSDILIIQKWIDYARFR